MHTAFGWIFNANLLCPNTSVWSRFTETMPIHIAKIYCWHTLFLFNLPSSSWMPDSPQIVTKALVVSWLQPMDLLCFFVTNRHTTLINAHFNLLSILLQMWIKPSQFLAQCPSGGDAINPDSIMYIRSVVGRALVMCRMIYKLVSR